jgi:ParB family chromosome partitioning protein
MSGGETAGSGVEPRRRRGVAGSVFTLEEVSEMQVKKRKKLRGHDGKTWPAERQEVPANQERYTPPEWIEPVHKTLRQIDLDPASCRAANRVVRARRFYTQVEDGLEQEWQGRLYINPPFKGFCAWMEKLIEEIDAHRVREAIIIGPANISAFKPLLLRGGLLLIPDSRPKFIDPESGKLIAPPFGTLFGYYGRGQERFIEAFGNRGLVLRSSGVCSEGQ